MDIDIKLNNLDLAVNTFNDNILAPELDDYIINTSFNNTFKNNNIKLIIKGILKKEEQDKLTHLLHKHYNNKYLEYKKIDKIDDYVKFLLFIIGIIAILIHTQLNSFLNEIFLIAGWVIIWEIIYDILFKTIKRKKKTYIYCKLSKALIEYK